MRRTPAVSLACALTAAALVAEDPDPSRLVAYAGYNNYRALRALLEAGVKPDSVVDDEGKTALIVASRMGFPDCLKLLLAYGADPDFAPPEQDTPLKAAAYEGRVESVELLLKAGADVNKRDRFGSWTPLFTAAVQGKAAVGAVLIAHGAELDAPTLTGATPLVQSSCNGHKEMTALLLRAGADVDWQDNRGDTPLICAINNGHSGIARLLLDASANPDLVNNDGVCAWTASLKKSDTSTLAALWRVTAADCRSPRK